MSNALQVLVWDCVGNAACQLLFCTNYIFGSLAMRGEGVVVWGRRCVRLEI